MLHVDRASHPAPACLSDERSEPGRRALFDLFSLDRAVAAQRSFRMSSVYVEDNELHSAVTRLFRGRCAFCETEDELRPYRFRPSEEAGPSQAAPPQDADRAHLYYAWLANAWENIYPICGGCHPRDPSIFPVTGRRRRLPTPGEIDRNFTQPTGSWITEISDHPLFLDPCEGTDLRKHLAAIPGGAMLGISGRGQATIQHYDLDRPGLQARRGAAFDRYRAQLLGATDGGPRFAMRFQDMEFGGGWYLLLYQIARTLGGGTGGRPVLSISRIDRYYATWLSNPEFQFLFDQAWFDLMERPEQLLEREVPERSLVHGEAPQPTLFQIHNFKALEKIEVRLPPPRSLDGTKVGSQGSTLVVLGENAAGKSTLLEAIALSLVDEGTRNDLPGQSQAFMLDPRLMGSPDTSETARRGEVRVTFENGYWTTMGVRPNLPTLDDDRISRLPVFAYGAFRLYLTAEKKIRRSSPIRSLFDAGYVLPNPDAWLASLHKKPEFEEVSRVLKVIFGFDQEGDVIVVKRGACYLRVRHRRENGDDLVQDTPLKAVSSGFRSVLAMVCDVMRGLLSQRDRFSASLAFSRAVVLIDEIEAHLHPRWKMRIVTALREALPNVTFIMTTHDPLCLRGLRAGEVMVFRRVESRAPDSLPVVVEQLEDLPDVGSLTVEQILTSDLFQLYSTDGPDIEARFAKAADLLAAERAGADFSDDDRDALKQARADMRLLISRAMPVGSTEVERLIQEAVEQYLATRRRARADALGGLRDKARQSIIKALEGL
ncbi:AAA family ATPase [Brevundimonas subvibrioides]|uniref:AAA ATPase n=1 Tax=Brevundimonas subvibrioides (strain ATCC 15264 / DSM 4735 / LMG 14903 / NBRC 16000 / CB 81) TaxID=633149 RepID=D9QNI3_BRESC|nr:ATP-binding protein [Brevundimonas subvibrioides]ADL02218.1 AAA ATPase [Brevundimonas subvibrioides ATCC 15264]